MKKRKEKIDLGNSYRAFWWNSSTSEDQVRDSIIQQGTAEFRNWTISQKEEQLSKYKGDVFITNNISSRENLSHCIFTVVIFPVCGNE